MSTSSDYSTDVETSTQKYSTEVDPSQFVAPLGLVVLSKKAERSFLIDLVSRKKHVDWFFFPTKSVDEEVKPPKETTFHDWGKKGSSELLRYMNRHQTSDSELEHAMRKIQSSLSHYIEKNATFQANSSRAYFSEFKKTLENSKSVRPQRLILVKDEQLFNDLKSVAKTGTPSSHTKSKNGSARRSSKR